MRVARFKMLFAVFVVYPAGKCRYITFLLIVFFIIRIGSVLTLKTEKANSEGKYLSRFRDFKFTNESNKYSVNDLIVKN